MTWRTLLPGLVLLLGIIPAQAAGEEAAPPTAAGVELSVEADRMAATIGDPIELTVRLIVPAGAEVRSFAPDEGLAALNILDRNVDPARQREDGGQEQVLRFRVAAYDLEGIEVPALQAIVVVAGGRATTVTSAPLSITIASVLAEGDSEQADIKSPAFMQVARIWPWLLPALLLLAAGAWWLWRRRRTEPEEGASAPATPPQPAHVVAYAELERLLSSGLLERGGLKEFYIELAEILKRYLEARFGIDTFERTTNEILEALRARRISIKIKTTAAEYFVACDMVKFAKFDPAADETRVTVERAYRIIDETKRAPTSPAPSPAPVSGGPAVEGSAP
jgi:hypothetical protein